MSDSGYKELANAIILQAVCDYRRSVRRLTRKLNDSQAHREKNDVESFFRSGWFQVLTGVDGKRLLSDLEKQMEARA